METLQRITQEATDMVVQTLSPGDDDYLDIEGRIMQAVHERILRHNNTIVNKGEPKLQFPKNLTFGQIAEILNATMTIRVIDDGDNDTHMLGVYTDGIYETDQTGLYLAATKLNGNMGKRDLEELTSRLMLICDHVKINTDRDLIAVNNGIFDFRTKRLLPFSEDHVFLSKSAVDYNANAQLKIFPDGWNIESWMKDVSADDGVCRLLWETAGAVLRPYVHWDKTIWLYSTVGNNGKGTYCELLRNLLGPKAHTSIPLADFPKNYALGPLIGKQAIITDENDVGIFIDRVALMKAVVTGDIITIEQKYKQPVNYRFRGLMVQCLNEYPKVKDRSDSFYRRALFIPFPKSFTGMENKAIKSTYLKDPEVLEYAMKKILNMDYYELSEPQACRSAKDDYKEINDPIRQFWGEMEGEFAWDLLPYSFLFDLYRAWYDKNFPRDRQVSRIVFVNSLRQIVTAESMFWECDPDPKKRIRPGKRMEQPEMLIVRYDLKDWQSKTYQGRDPRQKCTLRAQDLAMSYAGLTRKKNAPAPKPAAEDDTKE